MESLGMGFVMGWAGSMPLAGAVSIFVFQRGLAGHFRQGIALAAGAAVAEAVWCWVALVGAGQILSRWPDLENPARTVGGLILLALGLFFLTRKNTLPDAQKEREPSLETGPILRREFWLGLVLVAGNISIPFTWLGFITVAVSWGFNPVSGSAWLFSTGVALGIIGWFTLLLKILAAFRTRFSPSTHEYLMKAMALLLLTVGTFTLLKTWF